MADPIILNLSVIKQITFPRMHERNAAHPDRRGVIATFMPSSTNHRYTTPRIITIIQMMTLPLTDTFRLYPERIGQEGEQNDSYISERHDGTVDLLDRYWSDNMIQTFRDMLEVLAKRHEWTVEKEI